MDLLCGRELLAAGSRSWPAEPLRLCRPSAQFRLSLTACAADETAAVLPDDGPRCAALVTAARERRTAAARHSHPARRSEHQLYLREPAKGLEHEVPGRGPGAACVRRSPAAPPRRPGRCPTSRWPPRTARCSSPPHSGAYDRPLNEPVRREDAHRLASLTATSRPGGLATNGSGEAELAAGTAADLAERTSSELHVVHVCPACSRNRRVG